MFHYCKIFLFLIVILTGGCDDVGTTAKNTVNKTGKTVGKGTSEFFKGIKGGIDKSLQCKVELSNGLTARGIQPGKYYISSSKGASDNVLTIYFIFEKDFKGKVSAKLFDKNGREYGRTVKEIEGNKGEANFFDIVFSPRTEIESKSVFRLQ